MFPALMCGTTFPWEPTALVVIVHVMLSVDVIFQVTPDVTDPVRETSEVEKEVAETALLNTAV